MPEIRAVPAAATSSLFFSDDNGFGDFKFASPANSHPSPPQKQEDDEWGDFVASPLGSRPSESLFDPFPDPAAVIAGKAWERPRGALPLSIFGDEEEPEPLDHPSSLFVNCFSSPSPSPRPAKAVTGLGSKGDLKDLIVNLYCQPPAPAPAQGDDDLDWEFSSAFSPDAGVKKEEKVSEISGFEKKADTNANGIEVAGNRTRESQEATGQLRIGNTEQDLFDAYVAHDGLTNGFNFGPVVDYNHCISETNQQTIYINNGNELQPSLENGDKSDDQDCWEFKDAFSEVEDVIGSLGHQKIPDTEPKVLISTIEIQGTRNMWGNNMGDGSTPSYSNGKKDPDGLFEEHNGPSCEPTYVGIETKDFNFGTGVAFNAIISNLYDKADQVYNIHLAQNPSENGPKSAELGSHSAVVNDDNEFDEMHWEFPMASVTTVGDPNSALKLDQSLSVGSLQNTFLDLYCRLKEECIFLIVHHLNDLKKAHEVANISGEHAKVMDINEEIQAAYKKIQDAMISENAYIGKHPSREVCVSQLLDVMKGPHFRALEQEYCLQERILSAEKDLMAAIELFEHTISVRQILGSASEEEQRAYIIAWSKMALACSEELQHGAIIWAESLRANVCTELLSRGNQYFVALGEIYRVAEILRASLKLYKPWILSSQGDSSEVLTCLEKCAEAWTTSGLEKALENISNTVTLKPEVRAKSLLESIKLIHGLDELSFRNHVFGHEQTICKLSLLPMGVLQDMGTMVWNGEYYCLKLANLWANRVSCDPPQLPHIHVS